MSKEQYLKIIVKEMQKVNKKIDAKILRGEEYMREAREHKILLQKVRQFHRRGLLANLFGRFSLRFF